MLSESSDRGGMAEWLKAAVLKTVRGVTPSWVRILLPPPRHLESVIYIVIFGPHTFLAAIQPSDIDLYRGDRPSGSGRSGRGITARIVNSEVAMIRAFFYYIQKFRDPLLVNPAVPTLPEQTLFP